ncbi:unnamed protein product [Vitrella brassicaformis CCMP3155]|uniref:Protein kinase domain-containing protein n=1 Tax=Vitrella brassicaformis (strain CCMP3155) TaxID=1169540 RepID=A0A0G4EPD7_VITBC|nr:unnamed protein product [Vitrella brassicaformis CCMP3155]|eukprot:CEL99316.1 unnamed protein product [Vitrella brassicaformis CCMP3155]
MQSPPPPDGSPEPPPSVPYPYLCSRVTLQTTRPGGDRMMTAYRPEKTLRSGADGSCTLLANVARPAAKAVGKMALHEAKDAEIVLEAKRVRAVWEGSKERGAVLPVPRLIGVASVMVRGGRERPLPLFEKLQCDLLTVTQGYSGKTGLPTPLTAILQTAILQTAIDVVTDLEELHAAEVLHLDHNWGNIMFPHRSPFRALLIDFSRSQALVQQPGQTERHRVSRRHTMRGTLAFASFQSFNGRQLSRSLLSTNARTGWAPYQGAKLLKATLAKWRREVANMMPESIREGVFGGLRRLFATVDELPFGKLEVAVYEGIKDRMAAIVSLLDGCVEETEHQKGLQEWVTDAGFVVPRPAPPKEASGQQQPSQPTNTSASSNSGPASARAAIAAGRERERERRATIPRTAKARATGLIAMGPSGSGRRPTEDR